MIKPAVVLILIFSFYFLACDDTVANKKLQFYYYPARNIYYDVANAQFVFSVNGGKTWEVFKKDLATDPATLGARQVIYSDSPQPWTANANDVKAYKGKVYDIADADTSTQNNEASNKKIIKTVKAPTTDDSVTKKQKKPGFFKRLFGKKN